MTLNVKKTYQDVLYQLEKDSRQTFTKIGEKTDMSQQTVSYAVKTMQEDGVVTGFYPLFDYTKFGYNGYTVLFRVNTFSREKLEELKQMFLNHRMVASVDSLAGGWDLMVFFLAPNASQFNKEFKAIVADYPDQLWNYRIMTSVVIHDIGRKYLNAAGTEEELDDFIIGGDREEIELTEEMRELCHYLWTDPLLSAVDLAEKLEVTPKTVLDRISRLEEKGLVKGYRPNIGIHELGIRTHMLFVKYNNRDVEQENAMRDYCLDHPNVTLLMKTFGDYDAVIRIETEERDDQREVVNSIRERFEDILLDYDVLEIVSQDAKRYLPASYFEGEEFPED